MASAIEESARDGVPVRRRCTGWRLRSAPGSARRRGATSGRRPGRDRLVGAACAVLERHGYEPRRRGPTGDAGQLPVPRPGDREHTELVCEMNLALVSAVAEHSADERLAARLEPADGRCCVVLDVTCAATAALATVA